MIIIHTHILLKFFQQNGLDENTIKSLLSEKKFDGLKYKYQIHSDNTYSLTIFSQDMSSYEKKRDLLLQHLKNITEYLSITHDSITKNYIENIGNTIYDLERSFRSLIEFVLLKKFNSKWSNAFPTLGHDRKSKRGEPFIHLDNPLDNMDFIHLSRFAKEQINIVDHSLQTKLNLIGESISNINSSSNLNEIKDNILITIDELIHSTSKNKPKDLKYTELYDHITPSLSSDWEKLYNLRNFWAHNTALITRTEYETYNNLYKKVLSNIRTETTVLALFSGEQDLILEIGNDSFNVILYKSNYEGRATVQLKGKFINEEDHKISFKKTFVTYYDVLDLFNETLKAEDEIEKSLELEACFKYNPFLKDDFIKLGNYVAEKFNNIKTDKSKVYSFLLSNNYDIFTDDTKVIMSEDVDTYLRLIFKK